MKLGGYINFKLCNLANFAYPYMNYLTSYSWYLYCLYLYTVSLLYGHSVDTVSASTNNMSRIVQNGSISLRIASSVTGTLYPNSLSTHLPSTLPEASLLLLHLQRYPSAQRRLMSLLFIKIHNFYILMTNLKRLTTSLSN